MIREAVRARMGLIAEGTATDETGKLTVSGTVDSFSISLTGDAPYILAVRATDESNNEKKLWDAETVGKVSDTKTWTGLTWLAGSAAGEYRFSVDVGSFDTEQGRSTVTETLAVAVALEAASAASDAAAVEPASGSAAGAAAERVIGLGVLGEYSVAGKSLSLLPRENGYILANQAGEKPGAKIELKKGIVVELTSALDDTKNFFIFKDTFRKGDSFDSVIGGAVSSSYQDTDEIIKKLAPQPDIPADVRRIAKDSSSSGGTALPPSPEAEDEDEAEAADATFMPKSGEKGSDMGKYDPQEAAGGVQDKIRRVGVAVDKQFTDITEDGVITVKEVAEQNGLAGHTWISNSASDRGKFNLDDFSKGGDRYTYFALVNDETQKPIAFVVASDPEDNDHFSTGRFIGPDSVRPNLRQAFCYLYHRATGEVHDTCLDGPTEGPDDDVLKGSGGGGRGKGKGTGGGAGAGGGAGSGSSVATGGPSLKVKMRGTDIVRGKGDPQARLLRSVALERVTKGGKKFYTRAKTRFDAMGAGGTPTPAILKMGQKEKGRDPITLVVTFKNPVNIDTTKVVPNTDGTQSKMLMLTTLSPNMGPADIESIGFYYKQGAAWFRENVMGLPRSPGSAVTKLTAENDPKAFAAAAKWVFSNPQEFDLGQDIEFSVAEDPAASGAKETSSSENRGVSLEERAINEARRTRSLTPLFDRYRF